MRGTTASRSCGRGSGGEPLRLEGRSYLRSEAWERMSLKQTCLASRPGWTEQVRGLAAALAARGRRRELSVVSWKV